ncbi:glucans biosynthesis glucosyltransferase MdoH [Alloalcanivorax mobilis]|uniref:glucans biosynthesis glucosyltransferase MdoH n=1 Tax=Alloalcanivorax mobilis TaxID=2019569 RepID=UPI000B5B43AC|nr:glucans biosynthesis glucosyltransferase MdoH [Alloalcanivorax mobilis]ASK34278.1 glucan biosynthesis glucosyltransferase H [Alcanivorax sp. N3-2A]|tara:strand:+ start:2090 stop:4225 length:2136 start_codon:yes stop_codon:yes gene_type:complete
MNDVPHDTRLERRRRHWKRAAVWRRSLLSLLVLSQTLAGVYVMISVLPYHASNYLEQSIVVLFAVLFAWISVGFWTAMLGFVVRRFGGDRFSLVRRHDAARLRATPLARTAIVMPIYNEPVSRTLAGLRATIESLRATGELDYFDFYVLSDSRDADVWLAERGGWQRLCDDLGVQGRLFYRHRPVNLNFKSGNVADFLRRWGRDYRYMVVLDADSLMGGDTLVRLVRHMELEPGVGILQTNPTLVNARSAFARFQQFANQIYGPLFSTGLAAIQLGEAAYWGHNAIIRCDAFMAHCGLRRLPGLGLFRGSIMSHDFVEAAYMGRAGYEVWMEPELGESYEESPPTLVDELTRDRRWAKGNLQHLWLFLVGHKLRFAHRMAFLNGILSYLASPIWLVFLILTSIEATRLTLWPINYFPDRQSSMFPVWPEWHPHWAVGLILSTVFLLFFPKLLAIVDVLLTGRRRQFGGFPHLLVSVLGELLVSTLLAPIRMLAHSRYVLEALANMSLHWGGQNRDEETGWRQALLSQAPGTVLALGWAAFAWWLDRMFFFWSLPVALPLIFAAPTSVLLSRVAIGDWLRRRRLLITPEEQQRSVLVSAIAEPVQLEDVVLNGFEAAVIDPSLNRLHRHHARRRRVLDQDELAHCRERCRDLGPAALNRRQLNLLAHDADSLAILHEHAWQASARGFWGGRLAIWMAHQSERRSHDTARGLE